jgi:hypothetical protein
VQADTHIDIMTLSYPHHHLADALELQLFHDVTSAEEWLRGCQQPSHPPLSDTKLRPL